MRIIAESYPVTRHDHYSLCHCTRAGCTLPTEDAVDQIDLSEILQVTSPEMRAGLQPWYLFRGLAPFLVPSHPEMVAAFVGLITGHMVLKNVQERSCSLLN